MLLIEEIAETRGFKSLANKWNDLLSQSESDNIFLTWEWVFHWWQVYGNGKELCVLVVKDQHGDMVAIAPLYSRTRTAFGGLSVKEMRFLGTGEDVSPDYLNFIIRKGFENEAVSSLMGHLATGNGWDILHLTDMLSTSVTIGAIQKVAVESGLKFEKSKRAVCPYIRLLPDWDAYVRSLSSNMRLNIKRRMRNLEKDFKARYFVWEDTEELEFVMGRLASLHNKRWEQKGAEHSFSSERYNAFHQAVAREFALKGWLQLSCLELNGEIAAILYDYRYGEKIYYYQGGFDPSLYKYSPGLALRAHVIEKAIEDGLKEIDLLKGAYEHKYKWTDYDRQTINLTIGKDNLRSRIYFFDLFGKPRIKAAIKKALPGFLLERIRRARVAE